MANKIQDNTNLKERMVQLQSNIVLAAQMQGQNDQVLDELTPEVLALFNERWEKEFPKVSIRILDGFRCGCHCSDWEPKIFVYHIGEAIRLTNGHWAKQNDSRKYYLHNTTIIECPVPENKLSTFIRAFEEDTGVVIKLPEEKLETPIELKHLRTTDDLQCKFGPFEVLEEGEIWYQGWDIEDNFVIGRFSDGHIEAWYSTDAHGGGFSVFIGKGDVSKLDTFYAYLELNNTEIKTSKAQILQSWGK